MAKLTRHNPVGENHHKKKQSEEVRFCKFGTKNTVLYCQKYTSFYKQGNKKNFHSKKFYFR